MATMLEQSQILEDLRIEDFERTQLLELKTELDALETLNSYLFRATPSSIWSFEGHWYQVLWLSTYPFLQWCIAFSGVLAHAALKKHRILLVLRFQSLKWIYLLILAPVLGLLTIVWNITYYYLPTLIFALLHMGQRLCITKNMISNVCVDQALHDMTITSANHFSQSIAEYLLLVSAITYSRDSKRYAEAQNLYRGIVAKVDKPLPLGPILSHRPQEKRKILELFKQSEATMRDYAAALQLDVTVISELDSGYGGPTASLFVSEAYNVLIIGIRGTNPFDAREILVDAAFDKVTASTDDFQCLAESETAYLHRGFYSSLFSLTHSDHFPAKRIAEAVKARARKMGAADANRGKVRVFITGHSLGAAVASILSASLNNNLGPDIDLQAAYLYGTPMSSNASFCSSYRKQPHQKVWRVINSRDFVTKIPPSVNVLASDGGIGQMMDADKLFDGSILDYSAIGRGLRYHRDGRRPEGFDLAGVSCTVPSDPIIDLDWWVKVLQRTPLRSFVDHSPLGYSAVLKSARSALRKRPTTN